MVISRYLCTLPGRGRECIYGEKVAVAGIQCKCGRFLAKPRASCDFAGEGYSWHMFLSDVRGDCKRCGPGVQAMRGDGWWWSWDAWKWPAELEGA